LSALSLSSCLPCHLDRLPSRSSVLAVAVAVAPLIPEDWPSAILLTGCPSTIRLGRPAHNMLAIICGIEIPFLCNYH
jgi:hypothetical protein